MRFFADLDRTLIYSPSALQLSPLEQIAGVDLVEVEHHRDRPSAFVTATAARGLSTLAGAGRLVPVTTRSIEQYHRITLPGPRPALALLANGGVLLREGRVDEDFAVEVARSLGGTAPLRDVYDGLRDRLDHDFVLGARPVDDLFCFAVIDTRTVAPAWVAELSSYSLERGWTATKQENKVYLLPIPLSKGAGAGRVADALGEPGFIAAGDTLTDESLVRAAVAAMIPAHGGLAELDWSAHPAVTVTRARGALAGVEIVRWATDLG